MKKKKVKRKDQDSLPDPLTFAANVLARRRAERIHREKLARHGIKY